MATQIDNDLFHGNDYFQERLPHCYRLALQKFRAIAKSLTRFHFIFFATFLLEGALFLFLLPWVKASTLIAFAISAFFLTCFSYTILLFYFQAKKPEQFDSLKEEFIDSCQKLLGSSQGIAEHHLSIAEALSKLAQHLNGFEAEIYKTPLLSKYSSFFHSEDVFRLRELFLKAAIEEHLKQVRITPTDLEVHASLASTYVALAKLYRLPDGKKSHLSIGAERYSRLAIEEFKILSVYANNDPWVHEQMALGYQDLGLPEEETREVELLLKLKPQDKELLFRLGVLYFSQSLNAKGLQIYEELKRTHFKKAEDLITSYG